MQKTKLPNIVSILILTMITTVMWVGFSIYRAFNQAPPPSVPADISASLTPSFDTNTVNKVESALFFSESQVPVITAIPSGSASPAPTTRPTLTPLGTPTASPSGTPTSTPIATPTP